MSELLRLRHKLQEVKKAVADRNDRQLTQIVEVIEEVIRYLETQESSSLATRYNQE